MNFHNLACRHLARYKMDVLGVKEHGLFQYLGRDIPKSHILPIAHRKLNLLEAYRARYFCSEYANVKLHQFFHHLNSSQALCINLFYPLIAENALAFFFEFLHIPLGTNLRARFEKESEIEEATRRTSFDFYIQYSTASEIYVEVKYAEDGFGKAKNDQEHRAKFRETYLPLIEKSPFLARRCEEETLFLTHYQVLRNLVHISENAYVVLLFPAANTAVATQAIYAREHFLTDTGRARLKVICLDDFVSFLESQCSGGPLEGYYEAFRRKYLTAGG
jgi:hypothetical protein